MKGRGAAGVRAGFVACAVFATGCGRDVDVAPGFGGATASGAMSAPAVDWATFFGGAGDDTIGGRGLAVDADGSIYVAGFTTSTSLPGALNGYAGGPNDGYAAKFDADGVLQWSRYFGTNSTSSNGDALRAVALDGAGGVYVAGTFISGTTVEPGAHDSFDTVRAAGFEGYIAHLDSDGTRTWAAYLGASGSDSVSNIAVDGNGDVYVTLQTSSFGFPIVGGADSTFNGGSDDGALMKLAGDGSSILWSSYLGGNGSEFPTSVKPTAAGLLVAGTTASNNFPLGAGGFDTSFGSGLDGFVVLVSEPGTVERGSYVGGTGFDEFVLSLTADAKNRPVIGARVQTAGLSAAGSIDSTHGGNTDGWVAVLSTSFASVVWSTYVGNGQFEDVSTVAVDDDCNVYFGMSSTDPGFPMVDAMRSTPSGNESVLARINAGGATIGWSTLLGGTGNDGIGSIALDGDTLVVGGASYSSDFPVTGPDTTVDGGDATLARLSAASPRVGALSAAKTGPGGSQTSVSWTLDMPTGVTTQRLTRGRPCEEPWTVLQSWTIDASVVPGTAYAVLDAAPVSGMGYRVELVTGSVSRPTFGPVYSNTPPIADDDAYGATEDTTLVVAAASGVLAGDTDADGDALTASVVSAPASGTLSLAADGSFTYMPGANVTGPVTFTYRAADGNGGTDDATVTITIGAVNDAPVANFDAFPAVEDDVLTVTAPGVLANDADAENDALSATLVSGPSNGELTFSANGAFVYTPDANFEGTDSFTYEASDAVATSGIATVTITVSGVNDAPVAEIDGYVATEDTPLLVEAAAGVLANDGDIDDLSLDAVLVTGPSQGVLDLQADGSFTYTPAANTNGSDSFVYRADDGEALSDLTTVTITVSAVNDAPVAGGDAFGATEDTPLSIPAPGVLDGDTDVDSASLAAIVETLPANGSLALMPNGSFLYTPASNYAGADSFTYRADDGSATSAPATVDLTIAPVNDAPFANADVYTVDEDQTLVIAAAAGVLSNDGDVDTAVLTVSLVSGVTDGTLTLATNGAFTYTPDANANGDDTFSYEVSDGSLSATSSVTITVSPVNDVPTATDDAHTTAEDTPLVITAAAGVLANDGDIDGDLLSAVLDAGVQHGALALATDGSFVYTPGANYAGPDSFTYRASDGNGNSGIVTVALTVTPVDDAPVAANDAYETDEDVTLLIAAAAGVLANDGDVDSPALTVSLVTDVSEGSLTLATNGAFTYVPDANANGDDSFTYSVSDGVSTSMATVTIDVDPVNDGPAAVADAHSVAEDATLTIAAVAGVLANDTDLDGDTLTAVLGTDVQNGTLTLMANGAFTYTPDANYAGPDGFTYHANDGTTDSATVTVTIDVTPVNDLPIAAADSYDAVEDGALMVDAGGGVLGNDSDVETSALEAVIVGAPQNGDVALLADGSFTYTPDADFHGTDSFTYLADDGDGVSSAATVSIEVAHANDAPGLPALSAPAEGAVLEDGLVAFSWSAASDVDGDALEYRIEILLDGAVVAYGEVAALSHTLATPLEDGFYTWRVQAADASTTSGFTAARSFEIDAPSGGAGGGGGSGCACSTAPSSNAPPAGFLAGLVTLAIAFLRRRRLA